MKPTDENIAAAYGMTTEEYANMKGKIVKIHKQIVDTPDILQVKVYSLIEESATTKKEAVMMTAGICALSWKRV